MNDTYTLNGITLTAPSVRRQGEILTRFDGDRFDDARAIFEEVALREEFPAFLTVTAYLKYLREDRVLAAA